jgi:hypothetical protein
MLLATLGPNPIENAWHSMKCLALKMFPDIMNGEMQSEEDIQRVEQCLKAAWEALPDNRQLAYSLLSTSHLLRNMGKLATVIRVEKAFLELSRRGQGGASINFQAITQYT